VMLYWLYSLRNIYLSAFNDGRLWRVICLCDISVKSGRLNEFYYVLEMIYYCF
jgi:hypothetical protein